jgi:hypothetical protein
VELVINRSMDMFRSVIGWLPFLLIFVTTYVAGVWASRDLFAR